MRKRTIQIAFLLLILSGFHALAVDYTWIAASGSWTNDANWAPPGGPPASAADTGTVASGTAYATTNLGTSGNQPTIIVQSNIELRVDGNIGGHTIVLQRGRFRKKITSVGSSLTSSDIIKLEGVCRILANGNGAKFYIDGPIADGVSPGQLELEAFNDSPGQSSLYIRGTNNTYSGGTIIRTPTNGNPLGWCYAAAPGCFGSGAVTVESNATLRICATNTTSAGTVTVANGGTVQIGTLDTGLTTFTTTGHVFIVRNNASICGDGSGFQSISVPLG